jgi:hypothetical protein
MQEFIERRPCNRDFSCRFDSAKPQSHLDYAGVGIRLGGTGEDRGFGVQATQQTVDNYISLLPGESRALTITAATADLNGDAPLLVVDGWNVTVTPNVASGNQIAVTNNLAALASGFAADSNYSGGSTASTSNAVDTSAVRWHP